MIQPQRQVVNCGVPGYGPDQSLLLLKDRQLADPPGTESKIVFTIFAGNDFEDLLKNGITLPISPRAVSARNMVTSLLGRSRALLAIRRGWAGPGFVEKDLTDVLFFDPEVPLSENIDPEGAALRMRNVIVELKEIVPQQKILVLIIPPRCSFDKAACRENGKVVAEICRTLGIDFLDLQDRFDREPGGGASLFEVRSGHLSEGGNAVVAEELSLRLAS